MTTMLEKDEAHSLIDRMPADATGDDLMRWRLGKCKNPGRVQGRTPVQNFAPNRNQQGRLGETVEK